MSKLAHKLDRNNSNMASGNIVVCLCGLEAEAGKGWPDTHCPREDTPTPAPAPMSDIYTKRPISHDEAFEVASRLINSRFNAEPRARVSIPARPDWDDDLLILAYIEQQRARP